VDRALPYGDEAIRLGRAEMERLELDRRAVFLGVVIIGVGGTASRWHRGPVRHGDADARDWHAGSSRKSHPRSPIRQSRRRWRRGALSASVGQLECAAVWYGSAEPCRTAASRTSPMCSTTRKSSRRSCWCGDGIVDAELHVIAVCEPPPPAASRVVRALSPPMSEASSPRHPSRA